MVRGIRAGTQCTVGSPPWAGVGVQRLPVGRCLTPAQPRARRQAFFKNSGLQQHNLLQDPSCSPRCGPVGAIDQADALDLGAF